MPGVGKPPNGTVVLLHGRGDNAAGIAPLAFDLNREDLRVISVQAPLALDPLQSDGYEWYRMHEAGQTEQPTLLESLAGLASFIESLVRIVPGHAGRVVLQGFSQGAVTALGLQAQRPDLVSGVIAMSGYFPFKQKNVVNNFKGQPIFVGHGTMDTVIPIDIGRQSHILLKELGADVTYREYPISHQISTDELGDIRAWLDGILPALNQS